jgi:lipopolysaccharide transport system permease protein
MSGVRRLNELVLHLSVREIAAAHRFTALGWTWPVVRQLVQLGILVFVFTVIFDVGIDNYPAFVFSGLIVWSWFSVGVPAAARVLIDRRHLLFQPGFRSAALPAVAVAVPLIDLVIALPILVGMLLVGGDIGAASLLFVVLIVIQAVLMLGLAWLTAALNVHFRDVSHIVAVVVASLFYLTPVFYDLDQVPHEYQWILQLNPMTVLIDGQHKILIDGKVPDLLGLAAVAGFSVLVAAFGFWVFRRMEPGFVDEL